MREDERRGGRQRGAGRVMRTGSINRKYSAGYLLMLSITLLMFALSFVTTELLSARHRKTVDFLLELNSLFIDVENTNRAVYDYYLYLIPASGEEYTSASGTTRQALDALYERMGEEYSREVVDLCCMVDTFLTQSQQLIGQLSALRSAGSVEDNASIARLYAKTQDTISYINQSFQEAYTQQLTQVQRTQEQNDRMQTALSGFLMGMLVLALLVCLFFYRRVVIGITGAVNRLTDFAAKVTKEPASQEHIQLDTGDELSVLAGAFNEMLDTIHAQMNQIQTDSQMREQLQRVEMENLRISAALQSSQLRLLQSRINPHFLFNTLNMITQTAHMEDAEETAQLMEATAEFLRYNLGKVTKAVTLADEIENTRSYVYIQKCRFGERIRFDFEIDQSCADLQTPCMILQPLVENSISHGVGSMIEGGRVTVRLYRQGEGETCLEVEDNGVGISAQQLEQLRASFAPHSQGNEHIGLQNVYQRLWLYFGDGMRLELHSRPGCTLVRIRLRRGAGENKHGEEAVACHNTP